MVRQNGLQHEPRIAVQIGCKPALQRQSLWKDGSEHHEFRQGRNVLRVNASAVYDRRDFDGQIFRYTWEKLARIGYVDDEAAGGVIRDCIDDRNDLLAAFSTGKMSLTSLVVSAAAT